MSGDDCEEYYQRRTFELTREMEQAVESLPARNSRFVGLLRVNVDRKERGEAAVRDDVAKTRGQLEANCDSVATVVDQTRRQLVQFVDGQRAKVASAFGDREEAAAALASDNARLVAVVNNARNKLEADRSRVRSAERRLDRERCENERMMCAVAGEIAEGSRSGSDDDDYSEDDDDDC